jgi:uncharacterized protein YxeA
MEVCMKKVLLSMLTVMIAVVFVAGISFAADKAGKVTGKVKAMDAAKGTITICPSGTKEDKVYTIDSKMVEDKKIKVGTVVDATLDTKDALKITKIKKSAAVPVGC